MSDLEELAQTSLFMQGQEVVGKINLEGDLTNGMVSM